MSTSATGGPQRPAGWLEGIRSSRIRTLVLLRVTLILATSYLLVAELGPASVPWYIVVLLAAVFFSTALAPLVPPRVLESQAFIGLAILGDTAWITIALIASGRFSADFFYLYFFVLFLAGIGENLRMIALGVIVVAIAYLIVIATTGGSDQLLQPGALLRVPFLFAVAIFYGYLMDRIRHEQAHAREEAAVARRTEEHGQVLAAANTALAAEVAQRRRIEDQLQRANEELRSVAEMRVGFISMVTHELRNPLTAISNAATLLVRREPVAGDPDRRLIELVARNTDRMRLLVSDLLDLSKAETGRLRIEAEPIALATLLDNVVSSFASQLEAAQVTLSLELVPSAVVVLVDPRRVEQVLTNLVSNAIKACRAGGTVSLTGRQEGECIEISVADDGIGIAADEQARVFEPFYKAGEDLERRRQGTGLGLAISRDLVRAHGSELVLASEPGVGSRFSFQLPIDGPLAIETLAFEEIVRRYREHPYFSLLIFKPAAVARSRETAAVTLEEIRTRLAAMLPRTSDVLIPQPAHGRLMLVMLSTPRAGGTVVRHRIGARLATSPFLAGDGSPIPVTVTGPSAYPEDGQFGWQLVASAGAATPEEAP